MSLKGHRKRHWENVKAPFGQKWIDRLYIFSGLVRKREALKTAADKIETQSLLFEERKQGKQAFLDEFRQQGKLYFEIRHGEQQEDPFEWFDPRAIKASSSK
ncbi:MAG: hypothetical protein GQ575_06345 [Deltaproteobacteria bacterium]|nr:hypothetical protein [Deltaproteobacteria bacterium]